MRDDQSQFPKGAAIVFGATGGIGSVVALELAKAGSDVAIFWRSKEAAAKALQTKIKTLGRQASLHQCDVTDVDNIHAAIEDALAQHGRIHTMVWGAGPLAEQVHFSETSRAQWHKAFNVEVHGFFDACQAVLPALRNSGGSIVHLGSAGDLKWPDMDILSVTPKAANESLIKAIAREEGKNGVRANSVLIGVIEAGMFLELSRQGVFDQAWTEEVQKNLALKRWGQPEDIAHAAVFLASNKAVYVTGQQINVAGGYGI